MTTILLTGSNGYIGSEFIKSFHDHYTISTFSSLLDELNNLNLTSIDTVVHLAALVHQKKDLSYEDYYKVNVEYPLYLAKKAKESGVKHFLFMSTIAVYGENNALLNEHTSSNPHTFYGQSKLEAEKKLLALEDDIFCVSIIRPPMVYGENAPGNIASLVKLVKYSKLLPFGNIHNKRTFVYIENLLNMMARIIDLRKSGIFLAADDQPISTSEFCTFIASELGRKFIMISIPFFGIFFKFIYPKLHNKLFGNLEIDNSLSKKSLDYTNAYSTQEGIKNMLQGTK